MYQGRTHGWVEVVCGSMFSGKTEELLRRVKRAQIGRQKVQVFKPVIDNRYSADHVQSHNANRVASRPVEKSKDILKYVEDNTRVVGIDEVQFFDEGIVDVAQKLAFRGMRVICAGLDMDFKGQPFGPMPKLLAIAEEVTKLQAVCVVCGAPASRTQKLSAPPGQEDERIAVGAKEMYEARCRFCHEPGALSRTDSDSLSESGSETEPKNPGLRAERFENSAVESGSLPSSTGPKTIHTRKVEK